MSFLLIHMLYFILPIISFVSRQTLPYAQCDGPFSGLFRITLLEFLTFSYVHMLTCKCQGLEHVPCSEMMRGSQVSVCRAASPRPVSRVQTEPQSLICNSEILRALTRERFFETNLVVQSELNRCESVYSLSLTSC